MESFEINNIKKTPERRSCHTGVRTAAGWMIPVDTLIETGQINVQNRNTYLAMGKVHGLSN